MKRNIIFTLATVSALLACTSCTASAENRKSMYEQFSAPSAEYSEFVTTVAEAYSCNPWDVVIHKDKEYSLKEDERGYVVGLKSVPVYSVRILSNSDAEIVTVYAPEDYTTEFTLKPNEVVVNPAMDTTFCGYSGEAIADLFKNRNN